ncbi:MAG TPA: SRPBCC domain-containing protein [Caulobacteraceae bacterium]|jgi:uncharacterized protein YndB with AHSA1/START domain
MRALVIAAVLAATVSAARAEVVDVQTNGFEVRQTAHIAAPPARVYAALAQIGHWWNSEHSFSGDATNLSLEPKAGGCFCEALTDGGSVSHMRVVFAAPGKTLRLEGALGPMQTLGAAGHLTWALAAKDGGTDIIQTYDLGGYAKGGFNSWAGPVDNVLSDQLARLKRFVETGKP